ncbi:hypothetical protein H6G00_30275 [Leptolyngbya sp. FACHB-541]|uniref:type V CRISPR-associated protein Cas12k n=1 Tax=Leptolyngbya sp. FACHB-541 TaxID=2692810 RepID=UPI0016878514|nr:type V CRISPR-associated protein Cas12k [Leptolyngbya sp. FACHB-541]MBD2000841.1 hypothetical protein [Leptolyngbya sp. FACHB-541]
MSIITVECLLAASEATRQHVWSLMVQHAVLVRELLERVAQHPDFEKWQSVGNLPAKAIERLAKESSNEETPLLSDPRFSQLPDRFYRSAISTVQTTYKSWLALQHGQQQKRNRKQLWLDVVEDDLLMEHNKSQLDLVVEKAREILSQLLFEMKKEATEASGEKKDRKQTASEKTQEKRKFISLHKLNKLYNSSEDALTRRAIAHLVRNHSQVNEEEDLDKIPLKIEKTRIEIKRLDQQLKSQLPKGRDPFGAQYQKNLEFATELPSNLSTSEENGSEFIKWNVEEDQRQAAVMRLPKSLPYPINFGSNTDLRWFQETQERKTLKGKRTNKPRNQIIVRFQGLKEHSFKILCDRRQLPYFHQFMTDWKTYKELDKIGKTDSEKCSASLFLLRSARLIWREDNRVPPKSLRKKKKKQKNNTVVVSGKDVGTSSEVRKTEPWNTHRLYLQCSIDTRLLTAEGTEEVRQEEIDQITKQLEGDSGDSRKKKTVTDKQELSAGQVADRKRKSSTLTRLNNKSAFSRPGKKSYQGQSNILVGVSFSRHKPATVVVWDAKENRVLETQTVRQLLTDQNVKVKKGNQSIVQLRFQKYRLIARRRRLLRDKSLRCSQEQSQGVYQQSESGTNLGLYLDRLLAARIVELATKWKAGSIVIPKIENIRESIESEIRARAEKKFPGLKEAQDKYAKQFRISFHQWSYGRLATAICCRAERDGILIETAWQPWSGDLQDKAKDLAQTAYYNRESTER